MATLLFRDLLDYLSSVEDGVQNTAFDSTGGCVWTQAGREKE
jgi:hypothetical protein